jgi:nanoRNase/pAp phosphatase (c-di-AMP/oligoRNAs hydrolase)
MGWRDADLGPGVWGPPGICTAMHAECDADPATSSRSPRSQRFLATLAPFARVVLVSHVNPDPDALASMMGLAALLEARQPGKPVVMTVDGIIARAENQAMVDLLEIPLLPIADTTVTDDTALVMVDSQPRTGRRASEAVQPQIVLDHHETPGQLEGVLFRDIRPQIGATTTLVTGYLLEQDVAVSRRVATALLYGIESETSGYPREASPSDDGALVWLFPRADKDLLARIRNPRLPQSYFATYHHALANAFLYRDAVFNWCGTVPHPDIVAELADFFIRFDQVGWAISIGQFEQTLKISIRADHMGAHCGEVLRTAVNGMGTAGGHDKRAGGAVPLLTQDPAAIDALLRQLRKRILTQLGIDDEQGRLLLDACPVIPVP